MTPMPPMTPSFDNPSDADLDLALTAQIAVANAAEASPDDPRLGWWQTDLASEFGGIDLFKRLYPTSWRWAVVRALRAAGRAADAVARKKSADPDLVWSLFHFGPMLDERLAERLDELQAQHPGGPHAALPALASLAHLDGRPWDRAAFTTWLGPAVRTTTTSFGRQLVPKPEPADLGALVLQLTAALGTLPTGADGYPLPFVLVARP